MISQHIVHCSTANLQGTLSYSWETLYVGIQWNETYKYCLRVGIHCHPLWPQCGFAAEIYTFKSSEISSHTPFKVMILHVHVCLSPQNFVFSPSIFSHD